MKNSNNGKSLIIYLLVSVIVLGGLVYMLTSMSSNKSDKQYSEIMQSFDNLEVSEFELDLGSGKLIYKLRDSDEKMNYSVPNVSLFAQEVLGGEEAENYRKKYNEKYPDEPLKYNLIPVSDNSFWLNLIPTLLMLGVMIFFFVYMMKSAGGGKMSAFGKTNAKQAPSSKKATFADVAGADEEKEELKEIV
ncbi:MAG: ATP-dependent zinc metalloprotease FtsH, partial [Oscillospiraceae bacterium]